MMMMDRTRIALTTLCLTVACGPSAPGVGGGGSSGDSGTSTGPSDPSNPNPTNPDPDSTTTAPTPETTGGPTSGPGNTTGDPGSDGCCEVHDAPGCNEPAVVDCVCEAEASCCAFEWDDICVELATGRCDAVCEDPGGTTGDPPATTTGVGEMCQELVVMEMLPSEAIYTGAWELGMSMVGEGEISILNQGMGFEGSFMYEPDIPCNDTWYIWTRYWEAGSDDSYFVTIDGEPMPQAIFEGDCTGGGQGYDWAPLNWRDQGDDACVYVEDPWAPQWDAGTHQIEFSFRESLAMGRIAITNDPDYVP